MMLGAIEPANPTRPSFAVWRLLDYGQTPRAKVQEAMPLGWRKSCYYFGESQHGDVGGRESSWTMSRAFKAG